jgi:hypothetical protein
MRLEKIERRRLPDPAAHQAWLKLIDGRTYEVTGSSTREALSRLY